MMRDDIIRGLKKAAPITAGYIPIAFTISAISLNCGLSPLNTVLLFVLVDAGSSQLAAAHMIAGGAAVLPIIMTTFIINLRHLLMSSALGPHLRHYTRPELALFCLQLTDEAFALHSTSMAEETPSKVETFTVNMALHGTWILGGCLGLVAGSASGFLDRMGLDFAPAAMFIALLAMLIQDRLQVAVAVSGGVLTTVLVLTGFGYWSVILATLVCATLATLCEKPSRPTPVGGSKVAARPLADGQNSSR
jgi:4-azaleucine resistance transporter AzlC